MRKQNNRRVPRLDPRATEQTANEPQAASMISQNEALTKDQANVEGYRRNRGYQPDRQSVTTAGSSFPGPLKEIEDLDQTVAPNNATTFIKGDARTGKRLSVRAVHKQDAGLVIAAINPGPSDVLDIGT